jgi:hypothetical protein
MGWAAYQAPADAPRTRPARPGPEAPRLPPAADVIAKYVKLRRPGELKWQRIPWLVDLPGAIRQARAEARPLLLFVSGDDPLERC